MVSDSRSEVGVPGRLREVEAGKRVSKSKVVLGPFGPGHFGSTESPHPPTTTTPFR
jgi:hypothetical protein